MQARLIQEQPAMNIRQSIHQHLNNLPENLRAEVFDFVLFLEQKQLKIIKDQTPARECLADRLLAIPNCGLDADFMRVEESEQVGNVFD